MQNRNRFVQSEERFVPLSLLTDGVPNIEIHVQTERGMVVWYPDGSVGSLYTAASWRAPVAIGFVSLIPR